jgi:hypothetical protein
MARDGGWELGDLARAMLLAGLSFSLAEDKFASETRLTYEVGELRRLTTGTVRRPYRTGLGNRRGSWITVRLPKGFLKLVTMYAGSTGSSRNGAVNLFLKAGLLVYLVGYNKFLRTIVAETKSRPNRSRSIHKAG